MLNLEGFEDDEETKHRHYLDRRCISRGMRMFLLENEMRDMGHNWMFKSYSARDDKNYYEYMMQIEAHRLKVTTKLVVKNLSTKV